MNPVKPGRDVLYDLSQNSHAAPFLKNCQQLIVASRSTYKTKPSDNWEKLVDDLLAEMNSLLSKENLPAVKAHLLYKANKLKSSHGVLCESLEKCFANMLLKKMLDPEAKAKKVLYEGLTTAAAPNCIQACNSEIRTARTQGKSAEDLVQALISKMQDHSCVSKEAIPYVKNYLLKRASSTKSSERFKSLERLFITLRNKTMQNPADKKKVVGLTADLKQQIQAANAYLEKALPALIAATDCIELEKQLEHPTWLMMRNFLTPQTFASTPEPTQGLQGVLQSLLFSKGYRAFNTEAQHPRSGDGKEERNFFANAGRFLEHFGPYHDALWKTQDEIEKLKKNAHAIPQLPISLEMCNAFLEAGGEAPVSAFRPITNLPAIPTFTKSGASVAPPATTPPPKAPSTPPAPPPTTTPPKAPSTPPAPPPTTTPPKAPSTPPAPPPTTTPPKAPSTPPAPPPTTTPPKAPSTPPAPPPRSTSPKALSTPPAPPPRTTPPKDPRTARDCLHTIQQQANALNLVLKCKAEIGTAQQNKFDPSKHDHCERLVDSLLTQIRNSPQRDDTMEPILKPYLLKRAKKAGGKPFESLAELFDDMQQKKLLSGAEKLLTAGMPNPAKTLKKQIAAANEFLKHAVPALSGATDRTELKKQMSPALWNGLSSLLDPFAFPSQPKTDDALPQKIQRLLDAPDMVNLAKKEGQNPQSKELRNYCANVGNLLAHLSPYYNGLWTAVDTLNKAAPSNQKPISLDLCNAFLEAGGVPPIAKMPASTTPPAIPAFSKEPAPVTPANPQTPVGGNHPLKNPSAPAPAAVTPHPTPSAHKTKPAAKENRFLAFIKAPWTWFRNFLRWLLGMR